MSLSSLYLTKVRRQIQEGTFDETRRLPLTILRVAQVLRDITAMGDGPGPVEFDPPIEESV